MKLHEKNLQNLAKYNITGLFYDILDFPWEREYRKWRPLMVGDLRGNVLEAGVGTGHNLKHYHSTVHLTAMDVCPVMLKRAQKRSKKAGCKINLIQEDACIMESIPSDYYDWILATFLCCVVPENLQLLVLEQFTRVFSSLAGSSDSLKWCIQKHHILEKDRIYLLLSLKKYTEPDSIGKLSITS